MRRWPRPSCLVLSGCSPRLISAPSVVELEPRMAQCEYAGDWPRPRLPRPRQGIALRGCGPRRRCSRSAVGVAAWNGAAGEASDAAGSSHRPDKPGAGPIPSLISASRLRASPQVPDIERSTDVSSGADADSRAGIGTERPRRSRPIEVGALEAARSRGQSPPSTRQMTWLASLGSDQPAVGRESRGPSPPSSRARAQVPVVPELAWVALPGCQPGDLPSRS